MPNHAARSLASKKTGVIQIVSEMNPGDYYFTQLFTGAAHYLSEHGYSIMISKTEATQFQYDGIIFMGLGQGEDRKLYEDIKKPFVLFGKSDLPIDWVDLDNIDGVYKTTKYLIDQGHESIGFIRINHDEPFTQERFEGFKKAMNEAELPIVASKVYDIPHSIEGVRDIGDQLLADKSVTAYVCESDVIAYALIDYAKEQGLSIPEDLSVVGFDGFLFNQMSIPHITTVRQPVYYIGIELAKTLVQRLDHPDIGVQRELIKTIFEPGGSVAKINQ